MRRVLGMAAMAMALALCAGAADAAQGREEASDAQPAQAELVDLNTATSVRLETLPGVGPRTAERIIEYRREHGRFERIEDLMEVRGIGERTFLRLRPLVTVGTPEPDGGPRP